MRFVGISDIHANLSAMEKAEQHFKPGDVIYVTGDVLGYGPLPVECLKKLLEWMAKYLVFFIEGNHDKAIKALLCGKQVDSRAIDYAKFVFQWTKEQLEQAGKSYVNLVVNMPYEQLTPFGHLLIHGDKADNEKASVSNYILNARIDKNKKQIKSYEALLNKVNFVHPEVKIIWLGHTHKAGLFARDMLKSLTATEFFDFQIGGPIQKITASRQIYIPKKFVDNEHFKMAINSGSAGCPKSKKSLKGKMTITIVEDKPDGRYVDFIVDDYNVAETIKAAEAAWNDTNPQWVQKYCESYV